MKNNQQQNKIVIYKTKDGRFNLDVKLEKETVWLNQEQLRRLFGKDQSVISRHINNVFADGELDRKSNMQKMHIANSDKPVAFYNLDVIISVGYRVKSQRGVDFRKWATQVLRNFIIQGYAVNQSRLDQEKLNQLDQTLSFIKTKIKDKELKLDEAEGLLKIVTDYTQSWVLLQKFDESEVPNPKKQSKAEYQLKYDGIRDNVEQFKQKLIEEKEATDLFGNERERMFKGILGNIYQTFGGKELYPTIESKAAHLLYFVIKDHPFSDGNKRIGSFLFIWFLHKNDYLIHQNQYERKINDKALVALALLVAQSDPKEKEQMIKLIMNLIN